ncbi:MAG: outer membrane beta-barrel protein [Bacteroidales bacterium]|nr:outer membrane beta-barrel protein [Bacteroidales bacterium]
MKHLPALMMALLLCEGSSVSYSQKLTIGLNSGINISDIHLISDYNYSGKWKYKPGPLQGIFIDYSLNRYLGIKTGADYSTVYYEYHNYTEIPPYPILNWSIYSSSALPLNSSTLITSWYPVSRWMNFSYLTVPFQLRVTIPSRPQLSLAAGAYYSFLLASDYEYDYIKDADDEKNDLGFIYSAGLSYPVSERIDAMFNVSYATGRRRMPGFDNYWHGSAAFALGVSYRIIPGRQYDNEEIFDSINNKIYLAYRGGVNFSWNSSKPDRDKYSFYAGPSLGFNIGYKISRGTYFRTGLSFERLGYVMRDSSDFYHRYSIEGDADYYVTAKVSSDYIVVPALLEFYAGEAKQFYFNTGTYLGFKLNAHCTGKAVEDRSRHGRYKLEETTIYENLEQAIITTDIGMVAGAGLVLQLPGKCNLDIGLQFRQGFHEVYDTDDISESLRPERGESIIRNSTIALHAGIRLPVYK